MNMIKKKVKRGLAGFLAFCLLLTSVNVSAFAATEVPAADFGVVVQMHLDGEQLKEAAQEAIDHGALDPTAAVTLESLGLESEDAGAGLRKYEKLFASDDEEQVYELIPEFADDDAIPENVGLRVFVRAQATETYILIEAEDLIFLFTNGTTDHITFRVSVDENTIKDVLVKSYFEEETETEQPAVDSTTAAESLPEESETEETEPMTTERETSTPIESDSEKEDLEVKEADTPEEDVTEAVITETDITETDIPDGNEDEAQISEGEAVSISALRIPLVADSYDEEEDDGGDIMLIDDVNGTTPEGYGNFETKVVSKPVEIKGSLYNTQYIKSENVSIRAFVTNFKNVMDCELVTVKATASNATASNATLVVKHGYLSEGEYYYKEEVVTDIPAGTVVYAADYDKKDAFYPLEKSEPEQLELTSGKNEITLQYGMDVTAMANAAATWRFSLRSKLRSSGKALDPGRVEARKTASWTDYSQGKAEIVLNAEGEPIRRPIDVVLVLDASGSMWDNQGVVPGLENTWRLDLANAAARSFVAEILKGNDMGNPANPSNNRIGVVLFGGDKDSSQPGYGSTVDVNEVPVMLSTPDQAFTTTKVYGDSVDLSLDKILGAKEGVYLDVRGSLQYTHYQTGLAPALKFVQKYKDASRDMYVVMMSDGMPSPPYSNYSHIADDIKAEGATFYTMGLALGSDPWKLTQLASTRDGKPLHFDVKDPTDLDSVFTDLSRELRYAGTDAVIYDTLSENFVIDPSWKPPAGVSVAVEDGKTVVSWKVGIITKASKTLKIPIVVKEGAELPPGLVYPNTDVKMSYNDIDKKPAQKLKEDIGTPTLSMGGGSINLIYYWVNEDGKFLDKDGIVIEEGRENFKYIIKNVPYAEDGNTLLTLGKTYSVKPEGDFTLEESRYKLYGTPEAQIVTLNTSKPSVVIPLKVYKERTSYPLIYVNDGKTYAEESYKPGAVVTVKDGPDPGKEGYIFLGWSEKEDGSGNAYHPKEKFSMPEEEKKLYAVWEEIKMPELTIEKAVTKILDASKTEVTGVRGELKLDDVVTYTITVTNKGKAKASGIVLTDTLRGIEHSSGIKITNGTSKSFDLEAGESATSVYTYTVKTSDLGTIIRNTATATVNQKDVSDSHEAKVEAVTKSLSVTKHITEIITKNGTHESGFDSITVTAGDKVSYKVVVTNTGNVELKDIVLTDDLPGIKPENKDIPSFGLNASESKVFSFGYEVTEADLGKKTITNIATVKQADITGPLQSNPATVNVEDRNPNMSIEKTVAEIIMANRDEVTTIPLTEYPVDIGDTIRYQVKVENTGNVTLYQINVTDALEGVHTFRTMFGFEEPKFNLVPGQSKVINYVYTVKETDLDGTLTNTATASASVEGAQDPLEKEASVDQTTADLKAGMKVAKNVTNKGTGTDEAFQVGDTVEYLIEITNTGNKTLTNLEIVDTFDGKYPENFTIQENDGYEVKGTTVQIASLPPGNAIEIMATYTIGIKDSGTTLTNTAVGTSDENAGDTGEVATPVDSNDFTLKVIHQYDAGKAKEETNQSVRYNADLGSISKKSVSGYRFKDVTITADNGVDTSGVVKSEGTVTGKMPFGNLTITFDYQKEYQLSYDGNAADATGVPASSKLVRGETIVLPSQVESPTRPGYTFTEWNKQEAGGGDSYAAGGNFTMGDDDVVLYAQWTANIVNYKVEHYLQNLENDSYTLTGEAETLSGKTDSAATYTASTVSGFAFVSGKTEFVSRIDETEAKTGNAVLADGSLVVKLYYDRNSYDVKVKHIYQDRTGKEVEGLTSEEGSTSLRYGEAVAVAKRPENGYVYHEVKVTGLDDYTTTDRNAVEGTMPSGAMGVTVIYKADTFGPEGPETPDGTPDEFQAQVTYKVTNGTLEPEINYTVVNLNEDGVGRLEAGQIPAASAIDGYNQATENWALNGTTDTKPTTETEIRGDHNYQITFTEADYQLTVIHEYQNSDGSEFESVVSFDAPYKFGTTFNAVKAADRDGYMYYDILVDGIGTDGVDIVSGTVTDNMPSKAVKITFIYKEDRIGTTDPEDPKKPDGIPDEFQAVVDYAVVNGTITIKQAVVTLLDGEGKPSKEGTGYLAENQITRASANIGYAQSSLTWSDGKVPTTELAITGDTTLTANFDKALYPLRITHEYQNRNGEVVNTSENTKEVPFMNSVEESIVNQTGYVFWDAEISANLATTRARLELVKGTMPAEAASIKFIYKADTFGPEGPDAPDGTPDEYQAIVTYKANNGTTSLTWAVVNLTDAEGNLAKGGKGRLTQEQIPVATANSGYRQNSERWDVQPTITMEIKNDTTMTVSFTRSGGGGDGGGGTGGGGTGGPNPGTPSVPGGPGATEILPENVPLASLPPTVTDADTWIIDDGEVPLAALPKTGDSSASLQLSLLLSSLMAGLYIAFGKKRKENE